MDDHNAPSLDHIIPKSKGGKGLENNLQIAHALCNSAFGDKVATKEKYMKIVKKYMDIELQDSFEVRV